MKQLLRRVALTMKNSYFLAKLIRNWNGKMLQSFFRQKIFPNSRKKIIGFKETFQISKHHYDFLSWYCLQNWLKIFVFGQMLKRREIGRKGTHMKRNGENSCFKNESFVVTVKKVECDVSVCEINCYDLHRMKMIRWIIYLNQIKILLSNKNKWIIPDISFWETQYWKY